MDNFSGITIKKQEKAFYHSITTISSNHPKKWKIEGIIHNKR